MKFSVDRAALKQRVDWVVKASDGRAIIKTTALPGKLILEASDGMVWRKTECPAQVASEGAVFAPMGQFTKILSVAKSPTVELNQQPDSPNLVGRIGRIEFTLNVAEDAPRWSTVPETKVIATAAKDDLLGALKVAASVAGTAANSRAANTQGVQLILQASGASCLTFTATDSLRAIRISIPGRSTVDLHRLAEPAAFIDAIPKLGGDTVSIVQTENGRLLGVSDGITTSLAPLKGDMTLPLLGRLIDRGKPLQEGADLDRADLLDAMQVASASGETLASFECADGDATISSSRPVQGGHSTAETKTAIPMLGAPVSPFVMLQDTALPILRAVRSETLRMLRGPNPADPIYIREVLPDGDSSGITIEGVFMPIISTTAA